jgi:hypothetical protein
MAGSSARRSCLQARGTVHFVTSAGDPDAIAPASILIPKSASKYVDQAPRAARPGPGMHRAASLLVQTLDILIPIVLFVWCVMTLISHRRHAQVNAQIVGEPVPADLRRIDTVSDPLGRIW